MNILVKQINGHKYMVYITEGDTKVAATQVDSFGEVEYVVKSYKEKYNITEIEYEIDGSDSAEDDSLTLEKTETPLVLVFYIHRDTITQADLMNVFIESINMYIEKLKANIMALFLPTDGEERVECINPVQLEKPDMDRINKLVTDIEQSFGIGEN